MPDRLLTAAEVDDLLIDRRYRTCAICWSKGALCDRHQQPLAHTLKRAVELLEALPNDHLIQCSFRSWRPKFNDRSDPPCNCGLAERRQFLEHWKATKPEPSENVGGRGCADRDGIDC